MMIIMKTVIILILELCQFIFSKDVKFKEHVGFDFNKKNFGDNILSFTVNKKNISFYLRNMFIYGDIIILVHKE